MTAIDKLFQVTLQHSFYANMNSKGLSIHPSVETSRFIRDNRLMFRENESGFFVAGESVTAGNTGEAGSRKLKRALPKNGCMRFHVTSNSNVFTNITNLPVSAGDSDVYHFHNRYSSVMDESLLLHPSDYTGSDTTSFSYLKAGVLRYTKSGQSTRGTATIRSETGRVMVSHTAEPLNGILDFQFDMTAHSEGFYTLWFGNEPVKSYYFSSVRIPDLLLGVIEIETGSRAAGTHRIFDEEGKLSNPDFFIRFEQRSTFWRYHIINKSGTNIKNPVITAGEYTFARKENEDVPAEHIVFESEQSIPLKQHGIKNISLRRQTGAAQHMVLDNLPNPGMQFAEPDPVDHSKFYSDIYVYL